MDVTTNGAENKEVGLCSYRYVCNMGLERPPQGTLGADRMMYREIGKHADVQRLCEERK